MLSLADLSVGISRPCTRLERYPDALVEAGEALELGTKLWGYGRVTSFDMLGSYRFVPALVQSGLADDADYHQVSQLSDDLLKTLEAYLDSGGNTAEAARQLFLHRNTLRQRLDRIATSVDFAAPSRWLGLLLAIKVARIERLRSAWSAETGDHVAISSLRVPNGTRAQRDWRSA
jgi:PucR family transcriptional regulator, purine catabolism regulatory protein